MKISAASLAPLLALLLAGGALGQGDQKEALTATCVLANGPAEGIIVFTEKAGSGFVTVEGFVRGLGSNAKHGFHVHGLPITDGNCSSTGGHFNPFNATHGSPRSLERHVGDLGNISSDKYGVSKVKIFDKIISLSSSEVSIIGKSIVVHAGEDDLGRGGDEGSLVTGNAGARIGCCMIEKEEAM
ncbi:unnamed protein product [Ostreobium quekettii]|uniref:Superoxide dismutase [Cu-Zn] n=1 Tax=Ostreobium quekettii TaxID=121088 RepID=A0A8S1J070_9CHLO|nr:unnamed protein product [Ostreobium quekettii]|eukprot:evm.model.scf_2729.2 EVM.evm.TU.scf_2729.2   scf_2729:8518-10823(+)